jgi:hypothetical protein
MVSSSVASKYLSVKYLALFVGIGLWSMGIWIPSAAAQNAPDRSRTFSYTAKVICGTQPDPENLQLLRGRYLTAVNLFNRGRNAVKIDASIALAHPPRDLAAGEVHHVADLALEPGEALAIDCGDLKAHVFKFGFPDTYIDGFVVLESSGALSVNAVYTAAPLLTKDCCKDVAGPVASIDVEEIAAAETAAPAFPDLVPVPPTPDGSPLGTPGTGFCSRASAADPPGVIADISNIGAAQAGASEAAVDFGTFGVVTVPVGPLAPGGKQTITVPIPTVCFGTGVEGTCAFDVIADTQKAVAESLETNNTRRGHCRRARRG